MSDPNGENPGQESGQEKPGPDDAQKAIHRNLNSFLNPAFRAPPKATPDPNGALQLRMAQMELANKMRLKQSQTGEGGNKAVPMRPGPPPGGFGSAQGMFHMKRGNFGQKAKPTASKRSPYQQVLANASTPEKTDTPPPQEQTPVVDQGQEVIDVPLDAEVKQNEKPKRLRGKRFRNPTL